MNKIRPNLWFDMQAEDAARFYTDIFTDSNLDAITRYPDAGQEVHGEPAGEVVATDLSEKMVRRAQANADRGGLANLRFERMDAEELAYEDASFGAALCVLGLMYPAESQCAIQQLHRVLRPGGRVVGARRGLRGRRGADLGLQAATPPSRARPIARSMPPATIIVMPGACVGVGASARRGD